MVARTFAQVASSDLLALTKPRITLMAVLTVAAGFALSAPASLGAWTFGTWNSFIHVLIGSALVAGGTNALNQLLERDVDALMRRTAGRPLPAGRLEPRVAATFAVGAGTLGVAYLAVLVNLMTALIAAATLLSYVLVYTPLKRRTNLATLIGAVPGALPIVGGWTAAGGTLSDRAGVLFAILFFWQLPHFLALSWIHRDDYVRAGLRMLSGDDTDGTSTFRQAVLTAVALVPISLVPTLLGMSGVFYFAGALGLSGWLVVRAVLAARSRSPYHVRRLFLVTLAYLPAILTFMIADRVA
ncbi:MAG TPA: heme o synthase [Gemmatimonadaceae bacterium]|nr:heme o synthase [Gemmatimonadaceae bacterium]